MRQRYPVSSLTTRWRIKKYSLLNEENSLRTSLPKHTQSISAMYRMAHDRRVHEAYPKTCSFSQMLSSLTMHPMHISVQAQKSRDIWEDTGMIVEICTISIYPRWSKEDPMRPTSLTHTFSLLTVEKARKKYFPLRSPRAVTLSPLPKIRQPSLK